MLVRAIKLCSVIALGIMFAPSGVQANSYGPFALPPLGGFMPFQQQMFDANAPIDDTYTFDAALVPLGTFAVASTQDPNPPNHTPPAPTTYGIANLTFTWDGGLGSQVFTNGDGVLDLNAMLVATILVPGTYLLHV